MNSHDDGRPTEAFREAWVVAGRRAGKSRIAALIAVYLAVFKDYAHCLAPGETAAVMVLAAAPADPCHQDPKSPNMSWAKICFADGGITSGELGWDENPHHVTFNEANDEATEE